MGGFAASPRIRKIQKNFRSGTFPTVSDKGYNQEEYENDYARQAIFITTEIEENFVGLQTSISTKVLDRLDASLDKMTDKISDRLSESLSKFLNEFSKVMSSALVGTNGGAQSRGGGQFLQWQSQQYQPSFSQPTRFGNVRYTKEEDEEFMIQWAT